MQQFKNGEPETPYDLAVWLIDFEFHNPENRHMTSRELARIYALKIEELVEEGRAKERKLIEREVWEAKHREWSKHVYEVANTPIEVTTDHGKYLAVENIIAIDRAAPSLIRVRIAPKLEAKQNE